MIPTGQGNSSDKPAEEGKLPTTTTSHLHDHLSDEEKRLSEFVERKFPEWKDDKSMLFYMTNFKKSRQININDWDTRLKFWRNVLLSIISEFYKNSILIVTIGQMKTFMSRRKKSDEGIVETTLGWQTVIQQMIHDGDLISINEFKKVYDISNNQGITSWLVDVATTWFFGRPSSLTSTGSDVAVNNTKIHEDSQYIVMKPLKEITYNFIRNAVKNHVTNVDLYFCPSELRETHFPDYDFGQLDLLLRYMHCEEAAYVIEISNSKKGVVCFEESANKKTFLKQGEMSSQKAAGIIQLKETSCLLKKEVSSLELKVEGLLSQAKEYLTKGKRDEAKWILKKKKLVGTILEKRNAALHNVFELLSSIENSTSDIEVVKSLSVGASTLKQFNTELNAIQDESLENIAEALSDYKEIKNIIDSGMEDMNKIQGLEFDEEELSKELERMEMEPTSTEKKQPTTPQKENSSSKTPSENNKTEEPTSTFPTTDDLPTDSFAVLEYERDNSTNEEIKEFCALKLKMLNLKKKMNKFKPLEVVPKLQQKILQFEKQQQELKKKGDSVGCKKIDIYLSLLLTEIESFTETEEVQKEKVPVLN